GWAVRPRCTSWTGLGTWRTWRSRTRWSPRFGKRPERNRTPGRRDHPRRRVGRPRRGHPDGLTGQAGRLGGSGQAPACTAGAFRPRLLLHACEVADTVRMAAEAGGSGGLQRVDPGGVQAYKDAVVAQLYIGLQGSAPCEWCRNRQRAWTTRRIGH